MNQLIGTPAAIYLHDTDAFVNAAVEQGLNTGSETLQTLLGEEVIYALRDGHVIDLTILDADGNRVAKSSATKINGTYSFYNAEQAVRDHMLANNLALAAYTFDFLQTIGTGTTSTLIGKYTAVALILFRECRYGGMTADELLQSRFLSAAPLTFLMRDSTIGQARFHFHADIAAEGEDDELQLFTRYHFTYADPYDADILYFEEMRQPSGVFEWHSVQVGVQPYSRITLTVGARTQDIWLISPERGARLRFINRYNLTEQQHLPATLTHTPSTEKDYAVFGEQRQDYAVEHTDEFTLTTDPLPAQLHPALMDFVRSRKPEVWLGARSSPPASEGAWHEVVITDYELERQTDPATTIRLTATFQLADRRRRVD